MATLTAKPTGTTNGTSTNDLIYGTAGTGTIGINGGGGYDTASYERLQNNIYLDIAGSDPLYVYKSTIPLPVFSDVPFQVAGKDLLDNVEAVTATNTRGDVIGALSSNAPINVNLQQGRLQVGNRTLTATRFDHVVGSNYNDRITGDGFGNDLQGAGGGDILTGGAGGDRFRYEQVDSRGVGIGDKYRPGYTMDVITDFQSSQGDKIDLRFMNNPDLNLGLTPRWIGNLAASAWGSSRAGDIGRSGNNLVANLGGGRFLQVEVLNNAAFGANGQATGSWTSVTAADVLF